jgi:hypothetical protein
VRLDELLDGPLVALVRGRDDAIAPLLAREGEVRTLLAFSDAAAAERHRARLADEPGAALRLWTIPADDWRGKEELLRSAAALGAVRLDVDPDLALRPEAQAPLAQALGYVLSYKRGTACL